MNDKQIKNEDTGDKDQADQVFGWTGKHIRVNLSTSDIKD